MSPFKQYYLRLKNKSIIYSKMPKKKGGPTDEQCQRLPSTLLPIFTKETDVQKRHCSHNRK